MRSSTPPAISVPGFPNYSVTPDGVVIGARGRVLKGTVSRGYVSVDLWNGKHNARRVNRLVLEVFVGPPPSAAHESAHLNGNRLDNRLSNLSWKTRQENEDDKVRHGTRRTGERLHNARLANAQAAEIRAKYAAGGITQTELGRAYGVSQHVVSRVVTGKTYAAEGESNG